jgi:hypothetical protein
MPVLRSNMEAPLEPPLTRHRRNPSTTDTEGIMNDYSSRGNATPPPEGNSQRLSLHQTPPHFPPPSSVNPSPTRFPLPPSLNSSPRRFPLPPNTVNTTVNNRLPFTFNSPTVDKTPLVNREVNAQDLLTAMREQQSFIQQQQILFQQERDNSHAALREQHAFMADQQRQLMSLLVTRAPNSSNNEHHTNSSGPKVRMADPPSFDGSIKETENFLSSLANIFDSQPSSFPTPESKIRYSLTFLTGGASNWRKLLLRDNSDGYFDFSSWPAFVDRFRETFGNPHLVDEARRKLWTIRQGSRTSEDFFLEFEEIRLEANICENSVIMFLQAALRTSILNEVLRRDPPPKTYSEWKAASLRADHNQRNSAATRSFQQLSTSSLPQRQSTFQPFRQRFTTNNQTSNSANSISTSSTNPPSTQDSNKPRMNNNTSQKPSGTKNKDCWNCGDPNHFSRNCPNKSSNAKVRALLEQCEDLDAAYEAASTGAHFIRNLVDSNPEDVDDDECRLVLERFVNAHPVFVEYDE